jgi:HTH-type transcriptional repressor of NAD biosynthesis genes
MTRAQHGLVIGKFYPPHAGHHLLVRTAAATSVRVTVVVMASSVETLGLEERVAWMRDAHASEPNVSVVGIMDDLPVDFTSDAIWQGHVELMQQAARSLTSTPIDAVFSSEAYGEELGRRLSARHVLVDRARALVPISGTRVRDRTAEAWPFLSAPVRRGLALRIVLVGAESTGKTTLAQVLAARLRERGGPLSFTSWVPEYGRELSIEKLAVARASAALTGAAVPAMEDVSWESADFVRIATEQNRREQEASILSPFVIADTDAFATSVWHERYLQQRSPAVDALAPSPVRRLYLLTHPDDVPFTQDGVRDGEHIRGWMTLALATRLDEERRTWRWLRGATFDERLTHGLEFAAELEATAWNFAAPLG